MVIDGFRQHHAEIWLWENAEKKVYKTDEKHHEISRFDRRQERKFF